MAAQSTLITAYLCTKFKLFTDHPLRFDPQQKRRWTDAVECTMWFSIERPHNRQI